MDAIENPRAGGRIFSGRSADGSDAQEFDPSKLPFGFDQMLKDAKHKFDTTCKNDGCENNKRHGSAYCQACSDKYKAQNNG